MAVTAIGSLRNNTTPFKSGVMTLNGIRRAFMLIAATAADTYVTGGFTIDAEVARISGITRFDIVRFNGVSSVAAAGAGLTGNVKPQWDATNRKVQLYLHGRSNNATLSTPGTELTNATVVTGMSLEVTIVEKSV